MQSANHVFKSCLGKEAFISWAFRQLIGLRYFCCPSVIIGIKTKTWMYTIKFKFEQPGVTTITLKNIKPGYSLLEIALTNNIELRHKCGGICACCTCHLYLEKGNEYVNEMNDREKDFVGRAVNPRLVSRLGCQCLLHDGHGKIEVTLPDQVQFLEE